MPTILSIERRPLDLTLLALALREAADFCESDDASRKVRGALVEPRNVLPWSPLAEKWCAIGYAARCYRGCITPIFMGSETYGVQPGHISLVERYFDSGMHPEAARILREIASTIEQHIPTLETAVHQEVT